MVQFRPLCTHTLVKRTLPQSFSMLRCLAGMGKMHPSWSLAVSQFCTCGFQGSPFVSVSVALVNCVVFENNVGPRSVICNMLHIASKRYGEGRHCPAVL